MASLVSTGLGSGLDIEGLVTKLMAVEKIPITTLQTKEASFQAKITSYGTLKASLSTFQTAVNKLTDSSAFKTMNATVADTSAATATASSSANAGTYSLDVSNIALSQKLKTASTYAASTTTLGSGTLTIDFGTYTTVGLVTSFTQNPDKSTTTVNIDSSSNTLSGVRDAINAANAGVTASIVKDGSAYRLLVTSNDTGKANALRIQTTGSLSALAYDATGTLTSNLSQTQAATDASFSVDGISTTSASNTVTDAIDGVTLNLLKATSSSTSITVGRDTSTLTSSISGFVSAYNTLKTSLNSLTSYNATTKVAGALQGDATTRGIESQLRSIFNTPLTYATGGITTLTDIGISFKKDGTLTLDSSKLSSAINDTTKDIASVFSTVGKASDSLVSYKGVQSVTKPGKYDLSLTQVATKSSFIGNVAISAPTITASTNDTLNLSVDGSAVSVTLTAGSYTNTTIASELQSKINGALSGTGSAVTVSAVTAASLSGNVDVSAFTYPYSPASGNDSLQVTIGATTNTISLSGGTYASSSELATALQTKINTAFGSGTADVIVDNGKYLRIVAAGAASVAVAADGTSTLSSDLFGTTTASTGTSLKIESNAYGSNSSVTISGGTAVSTLFGTAVTSNTAYDVAGTIGGNAATGFGQLLTSTTGDSAGLQLKVLGGSTGSRGTVSFDNGFAVNLSNALTDILGTSGSIASKIDGVNSSISTIEKRITVLTNRLSSIETRYRNQFNSLDSLLASLQQTSSFLTRQLAATTTK